MVPTGGTLVHSSWTVKSHHPLKSISLPPPGSLQLPSTTYRASSVGDRFCSVGSFAPVATLPAWSSGIRNHVLGISGTCWISRVSLRSNVQINGSFYGRELLGREGPAWVQERVVPEREDYVIHWLLAGVHCLPGIRLLHHLQPV